MKKSGKRQQKILYFDQAATTPIIKRALLTIEDVCRADFGNPGSVHFFGKRNLAILDKCREEIADILGSDFNGIVLFGSATEANNFAVKGWIKSI
jgi:cysteine desulfurase